MILACSELSLSARCGTELTVGLCLTILLVHIHSPSLRAVTAVALTHSLLALIIADGAQLELDGLWLATSQHGHFGFVARLHLAHAADEGVFLLDQFTVELGDDVTALQTSLSRWTVGVHLIDPHTILGLRQANPGVRRVGIHLSLGLAAALPLAALRPLLLWLSPLLLALSPLLLWLSPLLSALRPLLLWCPLLLVGLLVRLSVLLLVVRLLIRLAELLLVVGLAELLLIRLCELLLVLRVG